MDLTTKIIVFAIVMLIAIPLHEFGHALAADYSGDDVPSVQGRVTVEPWAHWDPMGSLLIAFAIFSGFPVIGWGKPVLTDPSHYRNGKLGRFLVAIAGVTMNLLLAILGAIVFRAFHLGIPTADPVYSEICYAFVGINLSLAFFNLIPVPPLDGSKILIWLLPGTAAYRYERSFRGQGMVLLYLLVFLGGRVLSIPITAASHLLLGV